MARPKKSDLEKAKLQQLPQTLAAPPPVMMPQPPQGMPMQMQPTMVPQPPQHHMQHQMQHHQPHLQQLQQLPQPVPQGMQRVVEVEHFIPIRDSVINRLAAITGLIREFAQDYAAQTNIALGVGDHLGHDQHTANLLAQLDNASAQLLMPGLDALGAPIEEEKKRKKRTHDPNAPKRPLTPYFLYMQHARSVIAGDLGAEAPKGAVQEEGQRRWAQMGSNEKQGWNTAYQYNLRLYNARVHSYKQAGNPHAKDMTDQEALDYAEANSIPMPDVKDAAAGAQASSEQAAIAEQLQAGPGDDSLTKTPRKPAANRKRKSDAPAAAEATPQATASAAASPDKKRRRTSTKAPESADEPKKARGKKTKS